MAPQRQLITLPVLADWPPPVRAALARLDVAAARLGALVAAQHDGGLSVSHCLDPVATQVLHHPLSRLFPAGKEAGPARSRAEWEVLTHRFAAINAATAAGAVDGVARDVARDLTGAGDFRLTRAQTAADRTGRYVRYPPSQTIAARFNELGELLAIPGHRPASFDAVVALVAINNLHPFADGNGRVARVFFNALLQRRRPAPSFYLPLHILASLSRGGYVLRLRLAEIRGQWLPLIEFLIDAAIIWRRILAASA